MNINKKELEKYYLEDKLSLTKIGKIYNCDRKNISYWIKKLGIRKRTKVEEFYVRSSKNITREQIIKDLEKGMLINEIAKKFNVSRNCIKSRIKDINLRNHKSQTIKQSKFMKENNPVKKGEKREKETIEKIKIIFQEKYKEFINNYEIKDFRDYSKKARHLAYKEFNCGKNIPSKLEIDHIFSIKDGFINKVPLNIISNKFNLRLVTPQENLKKSSKSYMSLEELYKGVGVQRLTRKSVDSSESKSDTFEKMKI